VIFKASNWGRLGDNSFTECTVRTDANQVIPIDTDPTGTALVIHGIKNHIAGVTDWLRGDVLLAGLLSVHRSFSRRVVQGKLLGRGVLVAVVVEKIGVGFTVFARR
jgi:hypothetical protein